MKFKCKKITALFAAFLLVFISGCGSAELQEDPDGTGKKLSAEGMSAVEYTSGKDCVIDSSLYETVCSNGTFELALNKKDGSVAFINLKNGNVWRSSFDMRANGIEKSLNETWRFNLNSLIYISYFDSENNLGVDSTTNAFAEDAFIKTQSTDEGIMISYAYKKLGIGLNINITLTQNGFDISVPADSILETDKYRLSKITLLPNFGGAPSTGNGYIFYPDGSGAIALFDPDDTLKPAETISLEVYGTETLNVEEFLEEKRLERRQAMLPVFGMKSGDSAFFGIITEGDADACINFSTSNIIINMNCIYPSFCYRRRIDITSVNNSITAANDAKSYKFDTAFSGGDIKVSYYLLEGENANYSGMARIYRDYLKQNGLINSGDTRELPLSLSVFMGAIEDRALFSKYMTVTTYEQADAIISEMKEKLSGKPMNITLNGWNKGGYRGSVMKAAFNGKYGSKNEFEQISKKYSDDNTNLLLKQDYGVFDEEVTSFSKGKDVAYQGTGLTASHGDIYLPNLNGLFTRYLKPFVEFSGNYGYGISLLGPGSQLYTDYNTKAPFTRRESRQYTEKTFSELSEESYLCAEGNAYMLRYLDFITEVPDSDSGYSVTDEAIPFYQMVVHGSLPYSGTVAGNLSANLERLQLKWIEYGYAPYFEVTGSSSSALKYTDYNELFSSLYENWEDRICEMFKEMSELGVSDSEMVDHVKIAENVYRTTYSNGTVITVNYGLSSATVDGVEIDSNGYHVLKEE